MTWESAIDVADHLSRSVFGDVHLDIDYAKTATGQASDPEGQAYRTAITSLQLSDVQFHGANIPLLCDISTAQPCPSIPGSGRRQVYDVLQGLS